MKRVRKGRLSDDAIRDIRASFKAQSSSQLVMAMKYHVSRGLIYRINAHLCYGCVPDEAPRAPDVRPPKPPKTLPRPLEPATSRPGDLARLILGTARIYR